MGKIPPLRDEIRSRAAFMEELIHLKDEISSWAEKYVDVIDADMKRSVWHYFTKNDSCLPATHRLTSAAFSYGQALRYSIGTYDVDILSGRSARANDFGQILALQEASVGISPEDFMQLVLRRDIFGVKFSPRYHNNDSVNLRLWHDRLLLRHSTDAGKNKQEYDLSGRLVLSGANSSSLTSRSMVIGDLGVVRELYQRVKTAADELMTVKYDR